MFEWRRASDVVATITAVVVGAEVAPSIEGVNVSLLVVRAGVSRAHHKLSRCCRNCNIVTVK